MAVVGVFLYIGAALTEYSKAQHTPNNAIASWFLEHPVTPKEHDRIVSLLSNALQRDPTLVEDSLRLDQFIREAQANFSNQTQEFRT